MSDPTKTMFEHIIRNAGARADVMPMDNHRVFASADAGEAFKSNMFRIQADVLNDEVTHPEDLPLDKVALLDQALVRHLRAESVGIGLDDLVAVKGIGVYLAGIESDDSLFEPELLNRDEHLFGVLAGVSFNTYPYVPRIAQFPDDYRGELVPRDRDGLLMVLASAIVCSTEGYGPIENEFAYALVPLSEHSMSIYGAEVLD